MAPGDARFSDTSGSPHMSSRPKRRPLNSKRNQPSRRLNPNEFSDGIVNGEADSNREHRDAPLVENWLAGTASTPAPWWAVGVPVEVTDVASSIEASHGSSVCDSGPPAELGNSAGTPIPQEEKPGGVEEIAGTKVTQDSTQQAVAYKPDMNSSGAKMTEKDSLLHAHDVAAGHRKEAKASSTGDIHDTVTALQVEGSQRRMNQAGQYCDSTSELADGEGSQRSYDMAADVRALLQASQGSQGRKEEQEDSDEASSRIRVMVIPSAMEQEEGHSSLEERSERVGEWGVEESVVVALGCAESNSELAGGASGSQGRRVRRVLVASPRPSVANNGSSPYLPWDRGDGAARNEGNGRQSCQEGSKDKGSSASKAPMTSLTGTSSTSSSGSSGRGQGSAKGTKQGRAPAVRQRPRVAVTATATAARTSSSVSSSNGRPPLRVGSSAVLARHSSASDDDVGSTHGDEEDVQSAPVALRSSSSVSASLRSEPLHSPLRPSASAESREGWEEGVRVVARVSGDGKVVARVRREDVANGEGEGKVMASRRIQEEQGISGSSSGGSGGSSGSSGRRRRRRKSREERERRGWKPEGFHSEEQLVRRTGGRVKYSATWAAFKFLNTHKWRCTISDASLFTKWN